MPIRCHLCLPEPPCFVGPYEELVSTGRIDNVASCWAAVEAIIDADVAETDDILVAAAFDHEEVGSQSITGADSNNLPVIIEKLVKGMGLDNLTELMSRSMLKKNLENISGTYISPVSGCVGK